MKAFNFENDLRRELKEASLNIGFKISEGERLDKMLLDYLTVRSKLIDVKPRKVFINPLFKREIPTHPKRTEIEFIIDAARKGNNLNAFQSKKLLQTNFHDHLRNEWNIFHFHLSLKSEKKSRFVKQVNALLFAYIDNESIYFLGTDRHAEGIFGDTKWIEVLHDFFPEVIARFKDDRIISVSPELNARERQTLWNKGYTLGMTEIRGVVYHHPGIGRTVSGHSLINSKTSITIIRWVYALTDQLNEFGELICKNAGIDFNNASFKLRFGGVTLELFEESTNQVLATFPQSAISQ